MASQRALSATIFKNTFLQEEKSFLIGDRWRDIDMGNAVGCKTVFLDHHYDEPLHSEPDYKTTSIKYAVEWILNSLSLSV